MKPALTKNQKHLYALFTQAEEQFPKLYEELTSKIVMGLLKDLTEIKDDNYFIFSTENKTWIMEFNENELTGFFEYKDEDLI